ncbi:MAG: hypothetical protein AAGJ18_00270 [Bacteroidota bacterium]
MDFTHRQAFEYRIGQHESYEMVDKAFSKPQKIPFKTSSERCEKINRIIKQDAQRLKKAMGCDECIYDSSITYIFPSGFKTLSVDYTFHIGHEYVNVQLSHPYGAGATRIYVKLRAGLKWSVVNLLDTLALYPEIKERPEAIFRYIREDEDYFRPQTGGYNPDTTFPLHKLKALIAQKFKRHNRAA